MFNSRVTCFFFVCVDKRQKLFYIKLNVWERISTGKLISNSGCHLVFRKKGVFCILEHVTAAVAAAGAAYVSFKKMESLGENFSICIINRECFCEQKKKKENGRMMGMTSTSGSEMATFSKSIFLLLFFFFLQRFFVTESSNYIMFYSVFQYFHLIVNIKIVIVFFMRAIQPVGYSRIK